MLNLRKSLAILTLVATSVVAGCSSDAEIEEPRGSTEQAIAPAIAVIAACLADPPCASLVVLTLGYVVHMTSQIKPEDRPAAEEVARDYAAENAGGDGPRDDCKKVASQWQLQQAGIDAHEAKSHLGQMSRYEICKCDSGGFAIKLRGCRGDIIEML